MADTDTNTNHHHRRSNTEMNIETEATWTAQALMELIMVEGEQYFGEGVEAQSYEEASILTNDDGFVLRTDQGGFQITVVQSRY